jgi:hypothetical protein
MRLTRAKWCAGLTALSAALLLPAVAAAAPRTHDGFYLQLDLGLGYLSTTADAGPFGEYTYSGVTIPSAIMIGGTVGPVVIGGGLFSDYAFSPSAEVNGGPSQTLDDVALRLIGLGVFADIYPNPNEGLHFQPFIGWGGLEATVNGNSGGSDPTGLIIAAGVGYDFWVSDEWSIGAMGRFAYAPLKLEETSYSTIAPALLATFTYHGRASRAATHQTYRGGSAQPPW